MKCLLFILLDGLTLTQAIFESTSGWTSAELSVVDVAQTSELIMLCGMGIAWLALRKLRYSKLTSVELLVLSACRTAIGDDLAELGFAGLTLQSGAKSALASIWNVSDTGTLALMSEFYRQLRTTSTKAEALRQAQLKMLRGEVHVEEDQLRLSQGHVALPDELIYEEISDLSAPYYWAGFTMIGSPW